MPTLSRTQQAKQKSKSRTNAWDYLTALAQEKTERVEARQAADTAQTETKAENNALVTQAAQAAINDVTTATTTALDSLFGAIADNPELASLAATAAGGPAAGTLVSTLFGGADTTPAAVAVSTPAAVPAATPAPAASNGLPSWVVPTGIAAAVGLGLYAVGKAGR